MRVPSLFHASARAFQALIVLSYVQGNPTQAQTPESKPATTPATPAAPSTPAQGPEQNPSMPPEGMQALLDALGGGGSGKLEKDVPKEMLSEIKNYHERLYGPDGKSGFFKSLSDRFVRHESKAAGRPGPSIKDADVQTVFAWAHKVKTRIEKALFNTKLYTPEQRRAMLQLYIERVLIPTRELGGIFWEELNSGAAEDPVKGLLPHVPREVAADGSEDEKKIISGPNPNDPFGMMLRDLAAGGPACKGQRRLEFDFDPIISLTREIKSMSHAITTQNYVRGLKLLTAQLMIQQMNALNANLGIDESIFIPEGCRQNIAGGLPETVHLSIPPKEEQESRMDTLLLENGFVAGNPKFAYFFNDFVPADPNADDGGFYGYVPFERYRSARRGIEAHLPRAEEPAIDDAVDFAAVLAVKKQQALNNFPNKFEKYQPIAARILSVEAQNATIAGREVNTKGYSSYLVDLMKTYKTTNPEKLICPAAREKLDSTKVKLPMPRLDGPDASRRWGLSAMAKYAERFKNVDDETFLSVVASRGCPREYCAGPKDLQGAKKYLGVLASKLKPFRDEFQFMPKSAFDDEDIRSLYPSMVRLWPALSDGGFLPAATQSEWDYLNSRMNSTSWASLRLSYVIASQCLNRYEGEGVNPYRYFGDIVGISEPLLPDHGNKILSLDEKKQIWQAVVDEAETSNANLFSTRTADKKSNYFDRLESLHRQPPLLNRDLAEKAIDKNLPGQAQRDRARDETKKIFEQIPNAKVGAALFEIYNNRGNPKAQERIIESMEKYTETPNLGAAKDYFLRLDTTLKRPIYHEILREASATRKEDLKRLLRDLCSMDPMKDQEQFKLLVRKTIKSQDALNQMMGLQGLPPGVDAKLNEMLQADWDIMKLGGLQMVLFIGAAVFATAGTGGLAAAPAIGALLAAGAMGTQFFMAKKGFENARRIDLREEAVQPFADMGFTTREAPKEAREDFASIPYFNYIMAGMDASLFMAPLVGMTAKGIQMGPRALTRTGALMLRGENPLSKANRPLIRIAAYEAEVRAALYHVGLESVGKDLKSPFVRLGEELFQQTSLKDLTAEQLHGAFAKSISKQFKDDPERFAKFLESFTGRVERYQQALANWEGKYNNAEKMGLMRKMLAATGFPESRIDKIGLFLLNARKLDEFAKELKALERGSKLEPFIAKHDEILREILAELPVRKRDIPNHVLLMGGPNVFRNDDIAVKRIAISTETLLFEQARNEALKQLNLPQLVSAHETFDLTKSFLAKARATVDPKGAQALARFEDQVVERVVKHYTTNLKQATLPGGGDKALLKKILFSPGNTVEEATARSLWNGTPSKELFSIPELSGTADQVLKQLANYKNADEFETYLSALKVLTTAERPAAMPQ